MKSKIVPVTLVLLVREDEAEELKLSLTDFFVNNECALWKKSLTVGPPIKRLSHDQKDTFRLLED
jgi:hypothetical protein